MTPEGSPSLTCVDLMCELGKEKQRVVPLFGLELPPRPSVAFEQDQRRRQIEISGRQQLPGMRYHVTDMTDKKLTYEPDYRVPPGWVLEERIATMGLTCAEFAERCDLPLELIHGIIDGETSIELATAGRFESVLGVGAELWMSLENDYRRG